MGLSWLQAIRFLKGKEGNATTPLAQQKGLGLLFLQELGPMQWACRKYVNLGLFNV